MQRMKDYTKKRVAYFMDTALRTALQSKATRLQVGSVLVRNNRPILTGYNGLPEGDDRDCEIVVNDELKTHPEVRHSEENCIIHAAKEGIALNGCDIFITHNPCLNCAKDLHGVGIRSVFFFHNYRSSDGIKYLNQKGIPVYRVLLDYRVDRVFWDYELRQVCYAPVCYDTETEVPVSFLAYLLEKDVKAEN